MRLLDGRPSKFNKYSSVHLSALTETVADQAEITLERVDTMTFDYPAVLIGYNGRMYVQENGGGPAIRPGWYAVIYLSPWSSLEVANEKRALITIPIAVPKLDLGTPTQERDVWVEGPYQDVWLPRCSLIEIQKWEQLFLHVDIMNHTAADTKFNLDVFLKLAVEEVFP